MSRYGTTSYSTTVDVDVDDIVSDLTDKEIIQECRDRGLTVLGSEDDEPVIEVVRDLLHANLIQDALLVIEKHLSPIKDLARAYEDAKRNRDSSGRPVIQ